MHKKILSVLILILVISFGTTALASLTFTTDAITGTTASSIDLGVGNNFILQTSGGNVGIGTTTPDARLAITDTGSATNLLHLFSSTNSNILIAEKRGIVGIGVNRLPDYERYDPPFVDAILTVGHNWGGNNPDTILLVGSLNDKASQIEFQSDAGSNNNDSAHIRKEDSGNFIINNDGWEGQETPHLVISLSGNIGVGTAIPTQKLEVNGGIRLNTVIAKPTCDVTTRGTQWYVAGGAGVADTMEVCRKDASDVYAWVGVY